MKTSRRAEIRHRPAYFSRVCFANIPENWAVIDASSGDEIAAGDSPEDARALAERFGYVVAR
jgi:hypothetical protein